MKVFLAMLLLSQNIFATTNSISNDILNPNNTAYDITFTDDTANKIYINKTYIEVSQVVKEIEKIANALVPRDIELANCSSSTGCPIDSVQCDAVTESPYCPDGSTLNTVRDMCQKNPDVFGCPDGFTYDTTIQQCVKPLECPNGGAYVVSRNRCEYQRIYQCPDGYTQSGDVCIAPPACPSGATFDATLLKCTVDAAYVCGTGWTFNSTTSMCEKDPVCIVGTYNKTLNKCVSSYAKNCPSGFTLNTTTNRCEASPNCTSGTSYNGTTNVCESTPLCAYGTYNSTYKMCILAYTPTCASGYTYNATRDRCEKTPPDCPSGTTYNATTNRCEQGANSACTISGGTWNGTSCTVSGSYAATAIINSFDFSLEALWGKYPGTCLGTSGNGVSLTQSRKGSGRDAYNNGCILNNNSGKTIEIKLYTTQNRTLTTMETSGSIYIGNGETYQFSYYGGYKGEFYSTRVLVIDTTTTYTCPNGGTLSGTTCNTTTTVAPSCPAGYAADATGKCYANPTCPSSGSFDGNLDVCYLAFSKSCPAGMSYDSTSNSCITNPTCTVGTLNTSTDKCGISSTCSSGAILDTTADKCALAFSKECASGTTFDSTNDLCSLSATCDGGTLNTTLDKCQIARDVVCAQGVKDPTSGKCTFTAVCQTGATLNATGCNEEPIPLTCPSGTDTTLDVCYNDVDACKVNSTYPSTLASTLTYSDALNICIVDENIVCASSLTWSANYLKCEAVPICYNGMYNPENDFCYIKTKECPINASYPCKGPIGNQWCSPYECNPTTNQCGYAECPGGLQPSLTAEMSPSYNANLIPNASDTLCTNSYCDIANSSRFTYCGLEAACPSGFGVYEQNGQCFVRECPQDSFQENNKCYSLGCPKGTTEQGSGKCLVN